MDIATIKNFLISFALAGPGFSGASAQQITQRLTFAGVNNIEIKEGTYTPNNDYLWLWQNIPAASSPNFIFIQTPTALNISITSPAGGTIINAVPANKIFMLSLPPGFVVDNIYIEGRKIGAAPMPLGIEVQYFCLMAQASF